MSGRSEKMLACTVNALSALRFMNARDPHLSKLDFGVLKVALMVAALDGQVGKDEVEAFCSLAKKCRGYDAKSFAAVRESAFRSAGYIAMLAQHAPQDELLRAFTDESLAALPVGFACGSLADVRRAFVMWVAMGVSDGDFSVIERKAVEVLRQALAEIKRSRAAAEFDRWSMLSPTFRQAAGTNLRTGKIVLVDEAFMAKAEALAMKPVESEINALILGE